MVTKEKKIFVSRHITGSFEYHLKLSLQIMMFCNLQVCIILNQPHNIFPYANLKKLTHYVLNKLIYVKKI